MAPETRTAGGRASGNAANRAGLEAQPKSSRHRAAVDATAGGLAGAVSRVVVGPLDVVKIRMQVQLEPIRMQVSSKYTGVLQAMRTIAREEGVRALWSGTKPAVVLTAPYCAVQFAVLQQLKQLRSSQSDGKPAKWEAFAIGAAAGASGTVASYPFDLLRTILVAQGSPPVYKNMGDAAVGVVRRAGFPGLFSGLGITLLEIIPYAGVQFGTYDLLTATSNEWLRARSWEPSPQWAAAKQFTIGLVAGTAGKTLTHPLDVVKKRFQMRGIARSPGYGRSMPSNATMRIASCIREIAVKEGYAGFYKGIVPSVVKAAPASAVTFMTYELFVGALLQLSEQTGSGWP